MKQNTFTILLFLQLVFINVAMTGIPHSSINRKEVVDRHKIITTATNPLSPAQVGNGEFAFGVDITGLQTFVPFSTMAQWSWHSFPLTKGLNITDFEGVRWDTHGRMVRYEMENNQTGLSKWLAANPHRFNLGRIGFCLLKKDGSEARPEDIKNTRQVTDLWSGIIYSTFTVEGETVRVQTACHPSIDAIGVSAESGLITKGRLKVFIDFPYPDTHQFNNYPGDFSCPQNHKTLYNHQKKSAVTIKHIMDTTQYYASLQWDGNATFSSNPKTPHRYYLSPSQSNKLAFTCVFSTNPFSGKIPSAQKVISQSTHEWESFWKSGATIDLSESKDERWKELERRIVLSQYLMRVNEAGSLPPQESGLINNGWYGRLHFEMIWWHGVHYALWNRWSLFDKSLHIYQDYLPTSTARATSQGYKGARWPKCTGNSDREWPHVIHATLIWQQPHPIYFAELDYRLHPTQQTLEKWKDIVFATADFMADYAFYDKQKQLYVLGPPVYIVSENTDPKISVNPAFELAYWRFGLRTASAWRNRLSLPPDKKWDAVLSALSPLPKENNLYITHEGIKDMWTHYTFEHPALTGIYGMLPGNGVDKTVFKHTLEKVIQEWDFNRTWGWDFPMLAMAAARCGKPELAIEMLLHPSNGFRFDEHGLATGGPFPYFPSNGALLSAIAMMAGGWDGSTGGAPGFPNNGKWVVKQEGFVPMP